MAVDVVARGDLPFPRSLPEFQRLFPDEAACAAYLERARWSDGFICLRCGTIGEPYRYAARPGVLCCRACRRETRLTAGTVMERTHTPLRLSVFIEAPRNEIDNIIDKHAVVKQLVDNEWLYLFHIEPAGTTVSRYRPGGTWHEVQPVQ